MINNTQAPPLRQRDFFSRFISGGFAALWLILLFSVSSVQAATPLADATISNRASADYTDTGGTLQHTLSNEVTTTVTQVGSYSLVNNNNKPVAPGTTVYMPHTLTNTGNGSDIFNITLPLTVDSNLSKVAIFADTNGDGLPDSTTPLCIVNGSSACTGTNVQTGSLAPGGTFNFIVAMTVNAAAPNTTVITEEVTATPVLNTLYTTATLSNIDTLTVANNVPVFAVNKSISSALTSGPSGTQVTYKIAYTNNGNAAGPLYLQDLIGDANSTTSGFSYVANTATWSSSGATVLGDAGADPTGITYQANTVTGKTTIEALIANVLPNTSGFISFTVQVTPTAPVGTSQTTNSAVYARANTGTADCTTLPCSPAAGNKSVTNQSPFIVIGSYGVIANNGANTTGVPNDGNNVDATGNDLVRISTPAAPGATLSFSNEVWNTGNATDTFNMTIADIIAAGSVSFPAGTSFQLFKADGSTPLSSSDADGIPDTGPLLPGEHYTVVLKATLPADACSVAANCTVDKNATVSVTATSKGDPTKNNTVFDQLATITAASVDLTNVGTLGAGVGGVASPAITDMPVAPGSTAYFNLNVKNLGLAIDNYNLSYHLINAAGTDLATASAFVSGTLLSGWSVTFHVNTSGTGVCSASTLGAVVSNTGAVASLASANLCAAVKTPATGTTALAGLYRTYFQVTSGATGASDIKLDSVTLTASNKLSLITSGVGQIQPGGSIYYPHSLVNTGNASCGGNFKFDVTNNKSAEGWSYLLYLDMDTNGALDPAADILVGGSSNAHDLLDTATINAGLGMPALTAGSQVKLLVKVVAPAGAVSGAVDVISITATDPTVGGCGTTTAVTDTTNILAGQIRLVKTQALSAWNSTSSSCDAPGIYSLNGQNQKPGDCIWYKVVATNEGDAAVTDVVINDATPTFTTYAGNGTCTTGATLGAPAVGSTGVVKCDKWLTIAPAASTQLEFPVRINP